MADSISHLDAYRVAAREQGPGFAATLWGSPETQSLRFDIIDNMCGGLADTRVLDLGCGDGALYQWLGERGTLLAAYLGIDALDEQVKRAREVHAGATFEHLDISMASTLPSGFDWVVISGTLNTMDDATTLHVLDLAWDAAAVGLVFNFLSDRPGLKWQSRPLGPARRHHLPKLMAWALERTPLVACRQDYLDGHDATLVMHRSDATTLK